MNFIPDNTITHGVYSTLSVRIEKVKLLILKNCFAVCITPHFLYTIDLGVLTGHTSRYVDSMNADKNGVKNLKVIDKPALLILLCVTTEDLFFFSNADPSLVIPKLFLF